MSTVLFVTTQDIKKNSIISGNLDPDKFIQYVKIAQQIDVENYLGTKLYNRLVELIETGDILTTPYVNYLYLLKTYIKPMTIHFALAQYLPFAAYQVYNNGVYKKLPESAESVNKEEVDFITQKERTIAQHFTRRCIDYLCANSLLFPEYYQSQDNSGVYPDKDSNDSGWVL